METFLNENEVIDAVERAFIARGFATRGKCNTSKCGVDLYVSNDAGREWRIEAKGGTSATEGTPRFGKRFTPSQVSVHIAMAIRQALSLWANHRGSGIAIALPDDKYHRKEITAVEGALDLLGIHVIWVSLNHDVQLPENL